MNFQYLTVLMPCHSLEEFVAERPEDESEQLLSAWSALWHPALVAAAGKMPGWAPAAAPPLEPAGHLCVLPPCCEDLLPAAWLSDAEHAGARSFAAWGIAARSSPPPWTRWGRTPPPSSLHWQPISSPWGSATWRSSCSLASSATRASSTNRP